MFQRISAMSSLVALALLAAFLVPRPAVAQLGQGQHLYEWTGHQGRYAAGTSYPGGYGSSYYETPTYYATPTYPWKFRNGRVTTYQALYGTLSRTDYAYGSPTTTQSFYAPASTQPVWINVSVPADAQIWFDDAETKQTGQLRHFVSPPLTPGSDYSYEVTAKWTRAGKEITKRRHITVHAGDAIDVSFSAADAGRSNP